MKSYIIKLTTTTTKQNQTVHRLAPLLLTPVKFEAKGSHHINSRSGKWVGIQKKHAEGSGFDSRSVQNRNIFDFWRIGFVLVCYMVYEGKNSKLPIRLTCGLSWKAGSAPVGMFCQNEEDEEVPSNQAFSGKASNTKIVVTRRKLVMIDVFVFSHFSLPAASLHHRISQ